MLHMNVTIVFTHYKDEVFEDSANNGKTVNTASQVIEVMKGRWRSDSMRSSCTVREITVNIKTKRPVKSKILFIAKWLILKWRIDKKVGGNGNSLLS